MNKETHRSGEERRENQSKNPVENRKEPERRELVKDQGRTIELMKKLPIFQGLTDDDYKKLILICSKKIVPKDGFICRKGDESNELFILLKGHLKIMLSSTAFLTYVYPIALVGEIGIFTGSQRTASVLAAVESTVIMIHKKELFDLFKTNAAMSNRILLNVIADLASKLQEDNDLIEELRTKKRTRIL